MRSFLLRQQCLLLTRWKRGGFAGPTPSTLRTSKRLPCFSPHPTSLQSPPLSLPLRPKAFARPLLWSEKSTDGRRWQTSTGKASRASVVSLWSPPLETRTSTTSFKKTSNRPIGRRSTPSTAHPRRLACRRNVRLPPLWSPAVNYPSSLDLHRSTSRPHRPFQSSEDIQLDARPRLTEPRRGLLQLRLLQRPARRGRRSRIQMRRRSSLVLLSRRKTRDGRRSRGEATTSPC